MSINSIYPQIGKIIASTGSRQFPRLLHDLIQAHLCIDATQIRQLPRSPSETTVLDETVFSCDQATATATGLGDPSRLHRIRATDARVEIRVLRADTTYGFSALERNRLEAITPLVLPMLEKHLRALQPIVQRNSHESLEQRFIERLAQTGLKLSERERQVCLGLLAGQTAPEQAEWLGLRVNTVESYLRRAVIKLGIGGRHSLMRWMHA